MTASIGRSAAQRTGGGGKGGEEELSRPGSSANSKSSQIKSQKCTDSLAMSTALLLAAVCLLLLSDAVECAKLGGKSQQPAAADKSEFAQLDLQKRPLNFYVVANGKHATVQNKTLAGLTVSAGHNASAPSTGSQAVHYRIARPPFLIKQRGSVLLLNGGDSLRWHTGYPSLLQMMAAAGNAAVAVEGQDPVKVGQIIGWEELHGLTLLGAGKKGTEMALDAVEKEPTILDQLDAVLLANAPKGILKRIDAILKQTATAKGRQQRPVWVLLNKGRPLLLVNAGEEMAQQRLVQALGLDWDPEETENVQKVAQIAVNLMDFVHPR